MSRPKQLIAALSFAVIAPIVNAQSFSSVRSYWNPTVLDNLCSTSSAYASTPPSGYSFFRDEGKCFAGTTSAPTGMLGLRRMERWYSPSRGDHYTTTDSAWQGFPGATRSPDYAWQAHEGWLFPDPLAGTAEMREYFSAARGDNFITSDTRYNSFFSVPGYSGLGNQGYLITDPLGAQNLLPSFDWGEMFYGGSATGFMRLQLLLLSYTDQPLRHTPAQYQSLFFSGAFPNVTDQFWASSLGNVFWYNPGIRGPLTIADDPDTTGNEGRWQDVWDPNYAPILYLALRTSSGVNYVTASGGPGTGTSSSATGIFDWEILSLADINGGSLISGNTVAFKAMNRTWLRVTGTTVMGDGTSSATTDCRFVITKVSGAAGTQIVNNDVIRLQNVATGKFVRAIGGGGSTLICDATTPGADASFTILKTAVSSTVNARQILNSAVASGLNLAAFDDDGDGIVTDREMQLFIIGSGPSVTAGAGTRYLGSYTPVGSVTSVNLASVIGAGEDLSLATATHELTHALGAIYELYGPYGSNQNMTIMGATIYSNADDRQAYLHDPWTRMRFGWNTPRAFSLSDAGGSAVLEVSDAYPETSTKRPILLFDPLRFNLSTGEGEYFLLEYRSPDVSATSYDTNCAGKGLFLWQCKTGPGGANLNITSARGACCNGTTCSIYWQEICPSGWTYKGDGTACTPTNTCPTGTPVADRIEGSVNLLGGYPGVGATGTPYLRGHTAPWTQAAQPVDGIVPKYVDNTDAPVHIRVGQTSSDGRSLTIEWSYTGDLPVRIDGINKTRVRRTKDLIMPGMFGVQARRAYLLNATTGVAVTNYSTTIANPPTQCTLRIPSSAPLGTYRMYLAASATAFHSNEVQFQIVPRSDWNEDGVLSVQDIFDFLADWFAAV